jgi:hypothetical protein
MNDNVNNFKKLLQQKVGEYGGDRERSYLLSKEEYDKGWELGIFNSNNQEQQSQGSGVIARKFFFEGFCFIYIEANP